MIAKQIIIKCCFRYIVFFFLIFIKKSNKNFILFNNFENLINKNHLINMVDKSKKINKNDLNYTF